MGKQLERYATMLHTSASGRTYTFTVYEDGSLMCSCPAWKFGKGPVMQRRCKHLRTVFGENKQPQKAA